jgi:sulfoxide reductase catalytic subunit YedY
MLIKTPRGWEIPEREATPEHAHFSRRQFLAGASLLAIGDLATAAVSRNPEFTLDRPITPEFAATGYNNYYEFGVDKAKVKDRVGKFVVSPWSVEVTGKVNKPQTLDLDALQKKMPVEERLYRFRCVERWAMAVPWTGFPFSHLVKLVEPQPDAKFVRFFTVKRPDQMPGIKEQPWYQFPYFEGLRIDEAMNPLTLIVTGMYGKPLPKQNGGPVRMILPWKYGYKSPKSIVRIEFTNKRPSTFWNSLQPQEYGFYSNVNPKQPHPRWSQAVEELIPTGEKRPTQMYNGYEKWVASLYKGNEF